MGRHTLRYLPLFALVAASIYVLTSPRHPADLAAPQGPPVVAPSGGDKTAAMKADERFAAMPMSFTPNRGQDPRPVDFVARGAGYTLGVASNRAEFGVVRRSPDKTRPAEAETFTMNVLGGRSGLRPRPLHQQPGYTNILHGNDRSKYVYGLRGYDKVAYRGVYDGIDLVYYGNQRRLQYDFVVQPGADPAQVALGFDGTRGIDLAGNGELVLHLADGDVRMHRPLVYQERDGARTEVPSSFQKLDASRVGFRIAAYDAGRPLVIDPVVTWSTYVSPNTGGGGADYCYAVAVDPATGMAFVAGSTYTGTNLDAMVQAINPDGTSAWNTVFGSNGDDEALAVALDTSNNVYLTGYCKGTTFGSTFASPNWGWQSSGGGQDAFVMVLTSAGAPSAARYLGGTGVDVGTGIWAISATAGTNTIGDVYVTGSTSTSNGWSTYAPLASGTGSGTGNHVFLMKFRSSLDFPPGAPDGKHYGTMIGGASNDYARGMVLDPNGNAAVTGYTTSTDYPVTGGAYQTNLNQSGTGGASDAFITIVQPGNPNSTLSASTLYGGSANDEGHAITSDGTSLYIVGQTTSTNLPYRNGAYALNQGGVDAYLAKFAANLSGAGALQYSTYFGGTGTDNALGVAVESRGGQNRAYVAGWTGSTDLPVPQALKGVLSPGDTDGFIAKFDQNGQGPVWATFYGGAGVDGVNGIATLNLTTNSNYALFLAGQTASNGTIPAGNLNNPASVPPYQPIRLYRGGTDGFAARLSPATQLATTLGAPTTALAGVAQAGNQTVELRDELNRAVGMTPVPVEISLGNPNGATMSVAASSVTLDNTSAQATFTGMTITKVGSGYTLGFATNGQFTTAAVAGTNTNPAGFSINPNTPTQLRYVTAPNNTQAGNVLCSPTGVQVGYFDSYNNLCDRGTNIVGTPNLVTITLGSDPGGQVAPTGATSTSPVNGVATFPDLRFQHTGAGYSLVATASSGFTFTKTSAPFDITAAAPAKVVFTQQPPATIAAGTLWPDVKVQVQDSLGNAVIGSTAPIVLNLKVGGVDPTGTSLLPSDPLTVSADGLTGTATFSNLNITARGTGYKILASSAGLTNALSTAVDVSAAPAVRAAWVGQPSNTVAGADMQPDLTLQLYDQYNNLATNANDLVTVAIANNVGAATLTSTEDFDSNPSNGVQKNASSGNVAFQHLKHDKAGIGYTLQATIAGQNTATYPAAVSNPYTITAGTATHLAFSAVPTDTTEGSPINGASGGVKVAVLDSQDNVVLTDNTTSVIISNNQPASGTLSGTLTRTVANGVATFADLAIDNSAATGAVGGYTLHAQSGLLGTDSAPAFTIRGPAELAWGQQPSAVVAGVAVSPAVTVRVQDSAHALDTVATNNVTVSITSGPAGAQFVDGAGAGIGTTVTAAAVNGLATFGTLRFNKAGSYTLTASGASLTDSPASASFTVTHAGGDHLTITQQPTDVTSGAAITPALTLEVRDYWNNVVTNSTATVTLTVATGTATFSTSPSPATVVHTLTAGELGVATFNDVRLDGSGATTLRATAPTVTNPTVDTAAFNVRGADHLAFTLQPAPTGAAAGAVLPAVTVQYQDSLNNRIPNGTGTLTLTLIDPVGGTVLGGTAAQAVTNGSASFTNLTVSKPGVGFQLHAAVTAGTAASAVDSSPFTIRGPDHLAFTTQPSTVGAGAAMSPAVVVQVQDSTNAVVPAATGNIVLTLTNAPGASLLDPAAGTPIADVTVALTNGLASFATLKVDKKGTGYTLHAVNGVLSQDSTTFAVTAGAADHLTITNQPASPSTAGATLGGGTGITANVVDAYNNVVDTYTGSVTADFAPSGNPGGVAILQGTKTRAAAAGLVTFNDLSLNKAQAGYQLRLTAPGVATGTVDTSSFAVVAAAANRFQFIANPASTTAGTALKDAGGNDLQVEVVDAFNNRVLTYGGSLTATAQPGGTTLNGTTTATAVAGVATFSGLNVRTVGTGYSLQAGDGTAVTAATSGTFSITPNTPAAIEFVTAPTGNAANSPIGGSGGVQVRLRDAYNNVATGYAGNVAMAKASGSGALSGTTPQAVNTTTGIATFSDLTFTVAGDYTLTASYNALSVTSGTFTMTADGGLHAVFATLPTAPVQVNAAFTVVVEVRDQYNNLKSDFTGNVALSPTLGPVGASLLGTTTVAASGGRATFSDLRLQKAGTYKLTATTPGNATVTQQESSSFDVIAAGTAHLNLTTQPGSVAAGAPLTTTVEVDDPYGNLLSSATGTVTVTLTGGAQGATLAGTTTVALTGGQATFTDLSITRAGTNYALVFSSSAAGSVTSAQFNVTSDGGAHPVILTQPTTATAGTPFALQVAVADQYQNVITTYAQSITLTVTSPTGIALGGTTTRQAVNGVAAFTDLTLTGAGSYTLTATAVGVTPTVSAAPIVLGPSGATQIAFYVHPISTNAGATLNAVQVEARDAYGNRATAFTGSVTVDFGSNPGAATLSGTKTRTAVAGVATFDDLTISKAAAGYTLVASSGAMTAPASNAFNIAPATATTLGFVVQPSNVTAGATMAPAVQVEALDGFGNRVLTFSGQVVLSLQASNGAVLGGTLSRAAVAGLVSFPDLSVVKAGTGYTLTATSGSLTSQASSAFAVAAAPADPTQSTFTVAPTTVVADNSQAATATITIADSFGNPVPGLDPSSVVVHAAPTLSVAVTQPTAPTDANGRMTAVVRGLRPVVATVTVTINGTALSSTPSVAFTPRPVSAEQTTVVAAPASIGADGQDNCVLTVTLADSTGAPVEGSPVTARSISIAGTSTDGSGLTVVESGTITGGDGVLRATLRATAPDTYTVTPTVAGVTLRSVPVTARQVFTASLQPGLRYLGLPFNADDPRPSNVLPAGTSWRLARFDASGSTFVNYTAADNASPLFGFQPGHGLWVRVTQPMSLRVLGTPTTRTPLSIPLQQGWNNLANPYDAAMPWDLSKLRVQYPGVDQPLSNPTVWDAVQPYAWIWDGTRNLLVFDPTRPGFGSTVGSVPYMAGFWVYSARADATLVLAAPTGAASRAKRAAGPKDWALQLTATTADGGSTSGLLGLSSAVTRAVQFQRPPLAGDAPGVDLVVQAADDGRALAGELRPWQGGESTWTVLVTSREAGQVSLSWPSLLRDAPRGLLLSVVDPVTGSTTLLNTHGVYRYTASRAGETHQLQVRARFGNLERAVIETLSAQPTRGGGTTLTLTLTGPAELELTVRGLGGRVVKQLTQTATAAGTVAVTWDGTDQDGRKVPHGTYVVQASAVSENGAASRAVRTVVVP